MLTPSLVLRRFARTAYVVLVVCGANIANGQGITLPSARVVGPSASVRRLMQLVDAAPGWYPEAKTSNDRLRRAALEVVRYRLLLAPLTARQLDQLACQPTRDHLWQQLYSDDLDHGSTGLALAVRRTIDALTSTSVDATSATVLALAITGFDSIPPSQNIYQYLDSLQSRWTKAVATAHATSDSIPTRGDSAAALIQRRLAKGDSLGAFDKASFLSGVQQVMHGSKTSSRCAKAVPVSEAETGMLTGMLSEAETSDAIRANLDSLGRTARLVILERKTRHFLAPVQSTEQARVFWRQQGFSPLNLASVSGNGTASAAFTELAAPLLHAVRLSLNTVVATTSDKAATTTGSSNNSIQTSAQRIPTVSSTRSAASDSPGDPTSVDQFVNGGGQLNVGAAWPALFWNSRTSSFGGMVLLAPRAGGTLSSLGTIQSDATAFVDPGIEAHLTSMELTEGVGLFLQTRYGYASGGSDFFKSIGVSHAFHYANFAGGLLFGNKYLLNVSRIIGGPTSLQSVKWQLGITAIRSPQ